MTVSMTTITGSKTNSDSSTAERPAGSRDSMTKFMAATFAAAQQERQRFFRKAAPQPRRYARWI